VGHDDKSRSADEVAWSGEQRESDVMGKMNNKGSRTVRATLTLTPSVPSSRSFAGLRGPSRCDDRSAQGFVSFS
jgi:hypothetical protein